MATLSLHSRRDAEGHRVHPVARVRVTIPRDDDPLVLRLTLRSDGAILRQVFIPADPVWGGRAKWTQPSIWMTTTTGFPCCGAEREVGAMLVSEVRERFAGRATDPVTVEQEPIR